MSLKYSIFQILIYTLIVSLVLCFLLLLLSLFCLLACLVCLFALEKGYDCVAQADLELSVSPRKASNSQVILLISLVLGFCVSLYAWLHLLPFL